MNNYMVDGNPSTFYLRQLAKDLTVSMITIKRAYLELEN